MNVTVDRYRRSRLTFLMAVGAICFAGCAADEHPGVLLGQYQFSGQLELGPCTADSNPITDWTTNLTISASAETDRVWLTETAYGCEILASLRGSTLDGAGLSCPLSVAGFFQEEFSEFTWNFISKKVNYVSSLYAQNADGTIVPNCARAAGVATMQ